MRARKTTKLDLHVHTKGSDGWGTPDEIARKAVERGLDGLVITDHHNTHTKEGDRVAEACLEAGLIVFRGCEYSTDQGHVLVFGVSVESLRYRKFYQPIQRIIDRVRRNGGVVIPSHPYHGYSKKLGGKVRKLKGIPALEGRNGQCEVRYPNENKLAMEEAARMGIRTIGGSDAHNPEYIGCCYTEFKGWIDSEEKLVQALLHGEYTAKRNQKAVKALSQGWTSWARHSRKKTQWLYDHRSYFPKQTSLDSNPEMRHVGRHEAEANQDFEDWQRDFYGEPLDDPFYYSDGFTEADASPDPGDDAGEDPGSSTLH